MSELLGAIAATRFGLGASKGEIAAAKSDPRGWLLAQIGPGNAPLIQAEGLRSTQQAAERVLMTNMAVREMRQSEDADAAREKVRSMRRGNREEFVRWLVARNVAAVETKNSFAERWARFWSNHFTVSIRKPQIIPIVGGYEREAIRPHVFGSFKDLLHAAVLHPAMLVYLDNDKSVGPSTRRRKKNRRGLNENLAREVLELHTLGVDGGYDQEDVTSFAKALTGWTLARPPLTDKNIGTTLFADRLHEPGAHRVLGKSYTQQDERQAKAILDDLAVHPSTVRHLATKLARHFVDDHPPQSAIDRLQQTYLSTDGNLNEMAAAVINLDEAWTPAQPKFKTPEELLVSAGRALGLSSTFGREAKKVYESLGQAPFTAPSPDGWSDVMADWTGPDAIKKRLEWANRAARRARQVEDPGAFLDIALSSLASADTRRAVSRAESRVQGLTLALMAPEFQRR